MKRPNPLAPSMIEIPYLRCSRYRNIHQLLSIALLITVCAMPAICDIDKGGILAPDSTVRFGEYVSLERNDSKKDKRVHLTFTNHGVTLQATTAPAGSLVLYYWSPGTSEIFVATADELFIRNREICNPRQLTPDTLKRRVPRPFQELIRQHFTIRETASSKDR